MIGKFSSTGTILEFLLPCTLQILGNTISFLLRAFHRCREVSAAWKHQTVPYSLTSLSDSAGSGFEGCLPKLCSKEKNNEDKASKTRDGFCPSQIERTNEKRLNDCPGLQSFPKCK